MPRSWTLPLVLGVAILALWFAIRSTPGRAPAADVSGRTHELESQARALEQDVEAEPEMDSRTAESAALEERGIPDSRLRVRSEAELPFESVEVETEPGHWREFPLESGSCDLAGVPRPFRLRAPGHVPASVAAGDREAVLVPDALFTIEAIGLRACTDSIRPFHQWLGPNETNKQGAGIAGRLRAASVWDFVSDDRWAFAVSVPGLTDVFPRSIVDVAFVRADRQRTWLSFDAQPGARGTWNPVCKGQADVADLDVRVVRPEETGRGELELRAWLVQESLREPVFANFPGGHAVGDPEVEVDTRVGADADRATFPRLELGRRFSLTVRDTVSSAYGRVVFEHDGSAREVRLLEGLEIVGRLAAADGSSSPERARFQWKHIEPGEDEWTWLGEVPSLDLSQDGRFRLRSPARFPAGESALLELPRTVELWISAPGFAVYRHSFDTGGGHHLDCGEILLTPRRPAIVLAPGHGLAERAADWQDMRFAGRPDASWRLGECRAMADGSLAVVLRDVEPSFPPDPGELVSLHVMVPDGDAGRAFRRGPDGRYEAVPEQRTVLEIDCRAMPSNGKRWTIGWQWKGLWDVCGGVGPASVGERVTFPITAPADGAQLWWSSTPEPPFLDPRRRGESGSVPFQPAPWQLELP